MTELPSDLASCHEQIRALQDELARTRRKLDVHEENERQRMEYLYGRGATAAKLLSIGERMAPIRTGRRGAKKK